MKTRLTLSSVILNLTASMVLVLLMLSAFASTSYSQELTNDSAKVMDQKERLEAMRLTSAAFRSAVKKIRPALVTIESRGGVGAVQGQIGGIRSRGEGNTTGIMLSPDGHILTSTFNFVDQAPVITVITSDGKRRVATLLGRDDTRKLCLLKIDGAKDLPVVKIVDPSQFKVGEWAISVGVGYGDVNPAISMGIISAKNRIGGRAIQTDANISPANYGGPLVDIEGRLIGICVPMNPQSQAVGAGVEWYDSGIGFAIPLSGLEKLIERLKKGEHIFPAFLGIRAVPLPNIKGVVIEEVVSKSPAADADLQQGDRIIELNGEKVNDMMRLKQLLNRIEAGVELKLKIVRDGKQKETEVSVIAGRPPAPKGMPNPLEPPKIR